MENRDEDFSTGGEGAGCIRNLQHPVTAFRFVDLDERERHDRCLGHVSEMDPEDKVISAYQWSTIASKAFQFFTDLTGCRMFPELTR